MKFVYLITLAILGLIVPSGLIYTTSYKIRENYSVDYSGVIKGYFTGNMFDNKNDTLISGFFNGTIKTGGFTGTINGTMKNFVINESLIIGWFKGSLDGTLIEITRNSLFVLTLMLLLLVFYFLIKRPERIAGTMDRLFIIFSIGLGIDFGIIFLFLKIFGLIPLTTILLKNEIFFDPWGKPSIYPIFGPLALWLIFMMASLISRRIEEYNKKQRIICTNEQYITSVYILALLAFGIMLLTFLFIADKYFSKHWFIFVFLPFFPYAAGGLLFFSLMIFPFCIIDFLKKIFPKPTFQVEVIDGLVKRRLEPRFHKVYWTIIIFLYCFLLVSPILIYSEKWSRLETFFLPSALGIIAIFCFYTFYHIFKLAAERGILTKSMLKELHKSNLFFLISAFIAMIYVFLVVLSIPTLLHLMGAQPVSIYEFLVSIELPLKLFILGITVIGIYAFIFPYLFLIGFKPISIAALSFFASWGISEITAVTVEFATRNLQFFILSSFLVALFSYVLNKKKEKVLKKYAHKIIECPNCSKEINIDFEYCPWCSVQLGKT
jgi:hypothetical protein